MNRICCGAVVLVLLGCASGPKPREVKETIPKLADDQARIYFYRATILGAALRPDIKLNGKVSGESKADGIFFKDVSLGEYMVETSTEATNRLTLTCEKGQARYVRFRSRWASSSGMWSPSSSIPKKGRARSGSCTTPPPSPSRPSNSDRMVSVSVEGR
jgi:hypothetical protein